MKNLCIATSVRTLRTAIFWIVLVNVCSISAPARAAEPAWWTQQKAQCGVTVSYNTWVSQGSPCAGKNSTSSDGGISSQNQILLQGAGAIGTAIGQSLHESMFGSPQEDARKAQAAAEQQRLIEERQQEELRQQELSKQRILGALKGAESNGALALKIDSDQSLSVRESNQGIFGGNNVVPVGSGSSSLGGLQLKLGDDAEQSSMRAGRGFDTTGKMMGAALTAPPPVPASKSIVKLEKINTLKALLQKSQAEEKALNSLLDKLKHSPQNDEGAINDLQKMIVMKEDGQKKVEKELLDLTAEDE